MTKKEPASFSPSTASPDTAASFGKQGGKKRKKRPLSEDRAAMLDSMAGNLRKGELLQITFYDRDCYRTILGTLEMVDSIGRRLCLEGKKIDFEDIWEIEGR